MRASAGVVIITPGPFVDNADRMPTSRLSVQVAI
jgi:hypothetical protein